MREGRSTNLREKGELGIVSKTAFYFGEKRKGFGYHKAKVEQPLEVRISRLGEFLCVFFCL